ncbi:MAG: phage/plasmid primase, P4 family [Sulfurimonas sp.]
MSVNINDLFIQAKSTDFHDYLESFYQHEFIRKRTLCPFHDDSKPSATIKLLENEVFKCHACGWANNIIGYVMEREKCTNFEAAKKICIDTGKYSEADFEERELSDEEKKEYAIKQATLERERAERNRIIEDKKTKRRAALERTKNNVAGRLRSQAPELAENFLRLSKDKKDELFKMFVRQERVSLWAYDYLGYDYEHDSVCILNRRTTAQGGDVFNIKHRQKYLWEDNHINKNMRVEGKWISASYCRTEPFPLDYFFEHKDDRVVLCEGEKDALNLLGFDINTLTLGGVSNSWSEHAHLLKDKDVYIWFDHDKAGYENAIKRAKEIEGTAKSICIVSFMHLDRTLENKYDISDYLFDTNFLDKKAIFETIAFSCFGLSNQLINEFAAFYDDPLFTNKMQKERTIAVKKSFSKDIAHTLMQKSTAVKSADDEQIKELEEAMKGADALKATFKGAGLNEDEAVKKIIYALGLKAALLNQHRKMGESDIADHLLSLAKREGFEFASYRDDLYIWNGMNFEKLAAHQVIRFIIDWMEDRQAGAVNQKQRTPDMVDKVIKHLKYKGTHLEPIIKHQNDNGIRVINMLNGALVIFESGKHLFKNIHDPRDGCTAVLEVEYKPEAKAPKWSKFLERVLPDELERKALMQFFGYTLYPKHLYETFLFLYGESGANGKSVILETMRKCFGDDMVSHLDLQQFEGHQIVGLEGKLLNIGAEIDARNLNDGQFATLKKASGGEPLFLNPKGTAGYNIQGQSIPKFVFAGNSKPRAGMDGGVFRRMIFLNFNTEIPVSERVEKLSERFNDEMGGIINLALAELTGLIKVGKFAESSGMTNAKDEYKTQTDPILAYVGEHISINPERMIPRKYIYAHYKAWCEESGHHPMAQKTFLERLFKNRAYTEKRVPFTESNLGRGLSLFDFYLVGIEFSENSDITNFKLKSVEIALSHANFDVSKKVVHVREGLFS